MGGYIWVVGLALLAAIGVIAVANAAGDGRTDVRGFWRDLRSGLRRRRGDDARDHDEEPEPVDVPFDQLFAEVSQPDDGYLQLDELADVLGRTGERASRIREHLPQPRAVDRHAARRSGHLPLGTVAAPPAERDVPPQRGDA
ncbi:hypothetical protein [Cellulomonas sp. Marseille-Q8402]